MTTTLEGVLTLKDAKDIWDEIVEDTGQGEDFTFVNHLEFAIMLERKILASPQVLQLMQDARRFNKILQMTREERGEVLFFPSDKDVVQAIDSGVRTATPTKSPVKFTNQWRPISTAPKDGTWVRLWREPTKDLDLDYSPEIIAVFHYEPFSPLDDEEPTWKWPYDPYDPYTERGRKKALAAIKSGNHYWDDAFTHWMPLPEPPMTEDQA